MIGYDAPPGQLTDGLTKLRRDVYDLSLETGSGSVSVVVSTMALLRAAGVPVGFTSVSLLGYYAVADGGGGNFYWDSASVLADNGGTVINPTDNIASGRWRRIYSDPMNILWFGATGDGTTDDAAEIQSAIDFMAATTPAGGDLWFPKGNYSVKTSIFQKSRVNFRGEGSRASVIIWGGADTTGFLHGVVYAEAGTDIAPTNVFSTSISNLRISGNNIAPVALSLRGHQENCVFQNLTVAGFTSIGIEMRPYATSHHGVSFEDIHIISGGAATISGIGFSGSDVEKCYFRTITIDAPNPYTFDKGFYLYGNPILNIFDSIHTEDCDYGFYVIGGAENVFRSLQAKHSGAGIAHFYTTSTRYLIECIRTISGYTYQLNDTINTILAGVNTDSTTIISGGHLFQRQADYSGGKLTKGVESYIGDTGVGQTMLRADIRIPTTETWDVIIDMGAGNRGFAGKFKIFAFSDVQYYTELTFAGFGETAGTVTNGIVSAQVGTDTGNLTIGAPVGLVAPTLGIFRIPVTNLDALTLHGEVQVEMTIAGRQASSIAVVAQ